MVSKSCLVHLRRLIQDGTRNSSPINKTLCHRNQGIRRMATVSEPPPNQSLTLDSSHVTSEWPSNGHLGFDTHVTATVYKFPEMEPLRFAYYPKSQLYVPLRKDILHRAVIYEGDKTRQGTSFAKTRWDVFGSHKKLRKQKGTGMARVGDKQSPTRRGGGVSHGPVPRDFSTGLPSKVYDLAFRIALSYRYKRGQLVIVDAINDVECLESWYLEQMFRANGWGHESGRSSLITMSKRANNEGLFEGMKLMGKHGRIKGVYDVDVKNILEMGRLVVEKNALDKILALHSSDLRRRVGRASSELPPVDAISLGHQL